MKHVGVLQYLGQRKYCGYLGRVREPPPNFRAFLFFLCFSQHPPPPATDVSLALHPPLFCIALHCIASSELAGSFLFVRSGALGRRKVPPPLTTKSSGPPKYLSSPNRTSLRLACDTRRSFASNFQLTQTPIACQQQTQPVLGKHQTYPRLMPKTRRTSSSRWVRLISFISRRGACSARADIMRPAQYHPSDSALPTTCSPP